MPARILIIEDNPPNLELMSYLLSAFGHTLLTARDGIEGMEAATREPVDLIICDVQIPRIDGYEVARRLKRDPARRPIPLVAVTAYAMVGDRDRVLSAGFDGYLTKPIVPETFVSQVEVFLRPDRRSDGPAGAPADAEPSPPPSVTRAAVLIVDNVEANLDLARGVLEPFGYRVVTASTMGEALERARAEPPDLILSDVCMADGSGFDLLRAVRADPALRLIPFLFITATRDNERDRARGLALGAAAYLFRPVEPRALLAEIESRLRIPLEGGDGNDPDRR